MELVRLGELRLLHDRAERPVRAVHDHRRRARGRLRQLGRRHLRQDRRRAGAAPGCRVTPVLPDQLRHHRQRLRAAGRRRTRRPLLPEAAAHGGFRLVGIVLRRSALLHVGRPLAARGVRGRGQQHAGRLLAGQLLRDPGRHLHRGRARPRLLPGLGLGVPRRWRVLALNLVVVLATARSVSTRSSRCGSPCSRPRCGGPGSR